MCSHELYRGFPLTIKIKKPINETFSKTARISPSSSIYLPYQDINLSPYRPSAAFRFSRRVRFLEFPRFLPLLIKTSCRKQLNLGRSYRSEMRTNRVTDSSFPLQSEPLDKAFAFAGNGAPVIKSS